MLSKRTESHVTSRPSEQGAEPPVSFDGQGGVIAGSSPLDRAVPSSAAEARDAKGTEQDLDRGRQNVKTRTLFGIRWETLISISSPILLLVAWEFAAHVGMVDARFVPPPSQLGRAFVEGVASGQLLRDSGISLYRMTSGFALGASAGVLVGALAGMSLSLRSIIGPIFVAIWSIPKTALYPLFIVLFGFTETSKIVLLAISAFFLTQMNTMHGVMTIPRVMFDVARDCGSGRLKTARTVAIPGAMPYILAGLRLSWTVLLIVVVFVELKATTSGIGAFIMQSWRIFAIDRMMVGLIVLAAIGLVSNLLFDVAGRLLTPWKNN